GGHDEGARMGIRSEKILVKRDQAHELESDRGERQLDRVQRWLHQEHKIKTDQVTDREPEHAGDGADNHGQPALVAAKAEPLVHGVQDRFHRLEDLPEERVDPMDQSLEELKTYPAVDHGEGFDDCFTG